MWGVVLLIVQRTNYSNMTYSKLTFASSVLYHCLQRILSSLNHSPYEEKDFTINYFFTTKSYFPIHIPKRPKASINEYENRKLSLWETYEFILWVKQTCRSSFLFTFATRPSTMFVGQRTKHNTNSTMSIKMIDSTWFNNLLVVHPNALRKDI